MKNKRDSKKAQLLKDLDELRKELENAPASQAKKMIRYLNRQLIYLKRRQK